MKCVPIVPNLQRTGTGNSILLSLEIRASVGESAERIREEDSRLGRYYFVTPSVSRFRYATRHECGDRMAGAQVLEEVPLAHFGRFPPLGGLMRLNHVVHSGNGGRPSQFNYY